MTTTPCWNDPRIRSRERSDFVLKFDKLNNPRAMSQKKYNEVLFVFFLFLEGGEASKWNTQEWDRSRDRPPPPLRPRENWIGPGTLVMGRASYGPSFVIGYPLGCPLDAVKKSRVLTLGRGR